MHSVRIQIINCVKSLYSIKQRFYLSMIKMLQDHIAAAGYAAFLFYGNREKERWP